MEIPNIRGWCIYVRGEEQEPYVSKNAGVL